MSISCIDGSECECGRLGECRGLTGSLLRNDKGGGIWCRGLRGVLLNGLASAKLVKETGLAGSQPTLWPQSVNRTHDLGSGGDRNGSNLAGSIDIAGSCTGDREDKSLQSGWTRPRVMYLNSVLLEMPKDEELVPLEWNLVLCGRDDEEVTVVPDFGVLALKLHGGGGKAL